MACGCKPKKKVYEPPLPQYSVEVAGSGGSAVTIGAHEACVLEVNHNRFQMRGGQDIKMYDFQARALKEIGAPIWIVA